MTRINALTLLSGIAVLSASAAALDAEQPGSLRNLKGRKKHSKESKSSGDLVAFVEKLPGYDGPHSPVGTATVRYNSNGSFLVALTLDNVDSTCSECLVEIRDGTTCEEGLSGVGTPHYDGAANPWTTSNGAYYMSADGAAITRSAFNVDNGYGPDMNEGKVAVVTDASGVHIGCGVLMMEEKKKVLRAKMGKYPNYMGDLMVEGGVKVEFYHDDTFSFVYKIKGLPADCTNCGIHIHQGVSCDTHDEVMGHGWNSLVVRDLWTKAGGAIYSSDGKGEARGHFNLYNGYGYEENKGHAVVIHIGDGTRVACGQLM
eukprot:CAMPEP_0183307130 /NCGR_PEP_ID=MMETSP0160_2-20130417/16359_1 /TAXON_ID=2839 ORGANISM="Odontella Sinensis, Strain Grunow 1884" /NCGR_SAMPLE_ID=MMETSP0160_2 /ASSEMBLY_ACC=CAM_ASM_000250 /LENGTH=314 /DNA_ID=CAMNT_0025470651 /DNA_START=58 /DNA_END=1002 /DNA_ORIENTATION=-